MSLSPLARDERAFKRRTRTFLIGSGVIHALFLCALALRSAVRADDELLTEVTWIEPVDLAPPPPAQAPVAAVPEPAPVVSSPDPDPGPEHFERAVPVAELTPAPQVPTRTADAIASRLESLQRTRELSRPGLASLTPDTPVRPHALAAPAPAPVPTRGRVELTRDARETSAPVVMTRGTTPSAARALPLATIDTPSTTKPAPTMGSIDSTRIIEIAGAKLLGPVADRPLVSHRVPAYPEWAKREGVEGSVSLRFLVQPDGRVRDNVLVERTSGFGDFDDNAVTALREWRFESLATASIGDQWGMITFNYRLSAR